MVGQMDRFSQVSELGQVVSRFGYLLQASQVGITGQVLQSIVLHGGQHRPHAQGQALLEWGKLLSGSTPAYQAGANS